MILQYLELLEKTLTENGIKDRPDNIYNCDETGMVLKITNDKVLAPCGAKHVYSQSMGTREHLTVHACACTNRMMLPSIIIFAGWFPGGAYTHGGLSLAIWMGSCIYCGLRKSSSSTALWIGQLFSSKTGTNHTTLSMIKTAP